MMKVLLIVPYVTSEKEERIYPMEPLGLLYLATYAKGNIKKLKLDIEIKILDAELEGGKEAIKTKRGFRSGLNDEKLKNKLSEYQPDLVGINNNFTNGVRDVLEIAELVKKTLPKCILVLGGAHSTIAHEEMVKHENVDVIVRGEGEETFWQLVLAVYNKRSFKKILGISFKGNKKIQVNPNRPLIENLDTLPIPDRSLIHYKKYLALNTYFTPMHKPVATVFTSRGCPFKCIFCSTQKVWTNKWRGRSAENMLKEIEYLKRGYGVKEISFMDDQFMGSKERIKEFCKLVIKKKLKMSFIVPSGISPTFLDEEVIELMIKAGFYRMCFSVDVGTESAKKFVRKPIQLEKVRDLVKKANSMGMWTYATFVIGFPYEKEKDIYETMRYAYSLKLDFVRFYIAQPHLGSDLYDFWLKEGMINKDAVESSHHLSASLVGTKYISAEKLKKLRRFAEDSYLKVYIRNFLNPFYLIKEFIPKIFSFKKFKYFVRIVLSYRDAKKYQD